MTDDNHDESGIGRRHALECMLWAGTGVLWAVSGGVPTSIGLLDYRRDVLDDFRECGRDRLFCGLHPHMKGKIIVKP
jgi:hypothetical protein